ncbi:MAG: hypothetical protein OEU36_06995 [Gammaproteobacteria bacterium]|nr:hypothetical protein [Gammaproteobacteria bacterium]
MEFREGRTYQMGPEQPCTDQRVRTGQVLTNVLSEDHERSVFVLIDGRVPMNIATQEPSKFVLAARMASLLGWVACDQGSRVGGEIFSRHGHQHVRPSQGTISVIRLINMLIAAQQNVDQYDTEIDRAAGARAFDDALLRLNDTAKSGSLVFILSDFRVTTVVAERQLMRLSRHNKVVAVFLYDALERVLRNRCRYRNRSFFHARRNRLMNLMNRYAISLITCSTTDDPFACLRAYFYRDRGFENNRRH